MSSAFQLTLATLRSSFTEGAHAGKLKGPTSDQLNAMLSGATLAELRDYQRALSLGKLTPHAMGTHSVGRVSMERHALKHFETGCFQEYELPTGKQEDTFVTVD